MQIIHQNTARTPAPAGRYDTVKTLWNMQAHTMGQTANAGLVSLIILSCTQVFPGAAWAENRIVETTAEDTVNALNGVFGRHPGERSSHAKGFCAAGQFTPSNEAKAFSTTPLFKHGATPVTARLSTGGGNPEASDTKRAVRGLGARFHIGDDEELDLVLISAPTFFASTPAQFVEFLSVRRNDPATGKKNKQAIRAWNAANPNVMAHVNYVAQTPPPASYATTPYFSTHAFLFENDSGVEKTARWVVEPVAGFKGLTREQEDNLPKNFLKAELAERLTKGPAQWDIYLQVAQDADTRTDPSVAWPNDRMKINVGRLELTRLIAPGADDDCAGFIYDPNTLPTGIEPTDDPILEIRSPAYAVSFSRREE